MKRWIIGLVAAVVFVALLWYLPWWVSLGLAAIVLTPVLMIVAVFLFFVRAAKGEFARAFPDLVPKKTSQKLAAGQAFHGNGFQFALPVPCEVQQTTLDDFEALILKPRIHAKGKPGDSMLIVSTIAREEMMENATAKLDEIFSKIDILHASEFAPLVVGPLSGESRTFSASKDGKSVRGESAYLGDDAYSVAWHIITAEDTFDRAAVKYRELARLIERTTGEKPHALPAS